MTLRKIGFTVVLLLAFGLVAGCDNAPPQLPMQPPLPAQVPLPLPAPLPTVAPAPVPAPIPIPAPIPAAQGQELTPAEQATLKTQYTAEAAAQIIDANADAMAAALEQEIEAELATE